VPKLPKITPDMVQAAFDKNAAMLRFYDGETPEEEARLQQQVALKHPERNVLAFVVGYLADKFPTYSRENELVINACKAVMDAFVKAKQMAEGLPRQTKPTRQATGPKRRQKRRRRHTRPQ
jgi:hypothetical protein